ncbi:MAG: hypothetical protein ACI81P_000669 [Neolewinella sp.]|jgi:hypothetical protein
MEEIKSDSTGLSVFGQRLAPPMEKLRAQLLTKSYGVIESYADQSGSRGQKIAGTGQWL